ncbi:MAG TPA: pantoate--beta-alanine ligase [Acidimicrobiales bacterium]|nr:pantoate--beta-alanine ligase [Acidimicrobiales bacterium]
MLELGDVEAWRSFASDQRARGRRVGLVPTMGALHQGHESLFRAAKETSDVVLATIFVNPRQFDDARDLENYPRTPERDREVALACGVDCLVSPTLDAMWPDSPAPTPTTVTLGHLGEVFEGAGRPGHFDGVASVVAKLFVITGPCRAYFGEKDFQQLAVIRRMVRDLAFDVEVVGRPIIRDADGLALSSRNVLLSLDDRRRALGLSRALRAASDEPRSADEQRAVLRSVLDEAGVDVAYAQIVNPSTLVPSGDDETGERRALVAGVVGGVRLLDNGPVEIVGR